MKHIQKFLLSIVFFLLCLGQSFAQMVGDCVFLKGKYVEVGVAPNGGYGTPLPAPANYHPFLGGTTFTFYDPAAASSTTSGNFLGFVADYGRDGWTVGTPPFWGDYYLPGDPQEGWAIQIAGAESDAYIPSYQTTGTTGYTGGLAGTNLTYINSGGISKGIWKGTDGALSIRQTTVLDTNKLFFTVNVVLTNIGATPLTNVYYIRTVDPDNKETRGGGADFTTSNTITYQLPNPGNKVLVSATGTDASFADNAYLGLGTKDCRAKCMIFDGGLSPTYGLDAMWAGTTPYYMSLGYNYVSDVGIALDYNIGTIPPGDSTELTYAYILNAAYIDSALDATTPAFFVNTLPFNSGDSINLCDYHFDTLLISMGSGGFYNWHWSPDTLIADTSAISNVVNLGSITSALTYSLTGVNVAGGCDTVHFYLTLYHDTFLVILQNPDTTICQGQSVQTRVEGSSALGYSWTPATGVSNTTIQNPILTPTVTTSYTVTATSSLGCNAIARYFTVFVYDPVAVSEDSPYVKTCVGIGVPFHSTLSGSTTLPMSYTWSPPVYLDNSTISNPTVTPLVAGDITYTVTVYPTFNPSCFSTDTVHVHTVPNDFVLNNVDTPICLGNFVQGSITGSPEFSYLWIPPTGVSNTTIRNPTLTPTGTTTYIATANYAHCPEMYHSFTIEVDTLAPMLSYLDTICLGMHDTFSVAVAGPDTGSNYYHYQWGTSPDISNDTIPNPVITPGGVGTNVYTVNIHPHALGCAVTDVVTIYVLPNSISVSPIDTAICFGQVVQVVGTGNSNFTYQWIPTAGIASYTSISPLITPDTSALYTVTASFHRCPDMYATLNLNVQPNPSVYIGGNRFLCEYDTLHLNASVSPAWYGSYIYTWTPAANLDNNTTSTVVFSGLNTANLHLVVTTSAGCTSNDSALITVIPGNFATILPDTDFCPHDSMMLVPVSSVPGVTYHWYPAYYLSDSLGSNPVIKPISTQTYTIVATADGCKDTITFTATVHPAAVLIIPDSVTITPGESYSIEPSTNCTNFAWFPPAGLNATTISNPVARPDISTEYYVTATTDWGCITRDSITINIDGSSSIAMPNAFTPGNGVNNEFKVIMKGITSLNHFRIYNRWGNLLFETTSLDQGWDGTYKGQPQPFGVYVYEIEAVSTSGAILNKVGNITLLR